MKIVKSLEEQMIDVIISLGYTHLSLNSIKIKDEKLKIELAYNNIPTFFGGNDNDFKNIIKISSDNNIESFTNKLNKKVKNYSLIVESLNSAKELMVEYSELMNKNLDIIKNDLYSKLNCSRLEISAWCREYDIFHDMCGFIFYIHPKKSAPADGELILINPKYELSLFWSNYKDNYKNPSIDSILRRMNYSSDSIVGLNEKLVDLNLIQNFFNNYIPCEELKEVLELNKKGHALYLEVKKLIKEED